MIRFDLNIVDEFRAMCQRDSVKFPNPTFKIQIARLSSRCNCLITGVDCINRVQHKIDIATSDDIAGFIDFKSVTRYFPARLINSGTLSGADQFSIAIIQDLLRFNCPFMVAYHNVAGEIQKFVVQRGCIRDIFQFCFRQYAQISIVIGTEDRETLLRLRCRRLIRLDCSGYSQYQYNETWNDPFHEISTEYTSKLHALQNLHSLHPNLSQWLRTIA